MWWRTTVLMVLVIAPRVRLRKRLRNRMPRAVRSRRIHLQVRAAAVEGLAGLGSDVCSAVRPFVDDARLTVRVAAVDVLLRLGEDAWLGEHLLGDAEGSVTATIGSQTAVPTLRNH